MSGVPGVSHWRLAAASMLWEGLSERRLVQHAQESGAQWQSNAERDCRAYGYRKTCSLGLGAGPHRTGSVPGTDHLFRVLILPRDLLMDQRYIHQAGHHRIGADAILGVLQCNPVRQHVLASDETSSDIEVDGLVPLLQNRNGPHPRQSGRN